MARPKDQSPEEAKAEADRLRPRRAAARRPDKEFFARILAEEYPGEFEDLGVKRILERAAEDESVELPESPFDQMRRESEENPLDYIHPVDEPE